MTSDDLFFFDYVSLLLHSLTAFMNADSEKLASIPHDVRKYSLLVADEIDRHIDSAATVLRDTLSEQSWLPQSVRPSPRTWEDIGQAQSQSLSDRLQNWVIRNQAWAAAITAFVGTGCVLFYGSRKLHGKRRKARKAGNGARKEIVGMHRS